MKIHQNIHLYRRKILTRFKRSEKYINVIVSLYFNSDITMKLIINHSENSRSIKEISKKSL